jgi:hypothetical protein
LPPPARSLSCSHCHCTSVLQLQQSVVLSQSLKVCARPAVTANNPTGHHVLHLDREADRGVALRLLAGKSHSAVYISLFPTPSLTQSLLSHTHSLIHTHTHTGRHRHKRWPPSTQSTHRESAPSPSQAPSGDVHAFATAVTDACCSKPNKRRWTRHAGSQAAPALLWN